MTKSQDKEKENLIYTNGLGQMTKETLSKIFDTPENRNKEFQRGIKSERERILKEVEKIIKAYIRYSRIRPNYNATEILEAVQDEIELELKQQISDNHSSPTEPISDENATRSKLSNCNSRKGKNEGTK